MDEELLNFLFAAAIRFSGLPPMENRPPLTAMPYREMLLEICADQRADARILQAQYDRCLHEHPADSGECERQHPQRKLRQYEQCIGQHGLVAAYIIEQERIVYRADLDLESDSDNSFIVHEYVHALQRRHLGERLFESCRSVLDAERQAYQAQQRYLQDRGQLLRVGDRLRYVTCDDIR